MSDEPLHVGYLGNFVPEYSTENDYALAWRNNGHTVTQYQEGEPHELESLIAKIPHHNLVVWTRTRDLAAKLGPDAQWKLIAEARRHKVPIIGVHLDRFWDLTANGREAQIHTEPFFRVDMLLTADGGNQDRWEAADVRHHWLPPGVSERWCQPGTPRAKYEAEIAFVGSWQGGYHREWQHRYDLVQWLDRTYGKRVKFWPRPGEHAIRGTALTDLYWSTKVVVGDSCLVPRSDGSPITHYCSDRIPETVGRGGPLVHPWVQGVNCERLRVTDPDQPFYGMGWNWQLYDWDDLRDVIDSELEDPEMDDDWRRHMIRYVKAEHTYERRVPQILDILHQEDLL